MGDRNGISASGLGTLYGVGVGPGDPELLTLRAHRILGSVAAVFGPKSKQEGESIAVSIARPSIGEKAVIHEMLFPMTSDEKVLLPFWKKAASQVLVHLRKGEDVAFVTLGDPSIYSTFCYLVRAVHAEEADVTVEYVPGVTSFSAAAARLGRGLVEGQQPLAIIPSTTSWESLPKEVRETFSLVLMKAGRGLIDIQENLRAGNRLAGAALASRVGLSGEKLIDDISLGGFDPSKKDGEYLTLLLVPGRDGPGA